MKEIMLTQGKVALVDDEDFEWLNQFKWQACARKHTTYVKSNIGLGAERKTVFMHRLILGITNTKIIGEHKDRNGLNNQRDNLRVANQSQNRANSLPKRNSTSKYLGVSWSKTHKSWLVAIGKNRKVKHIGRFKNEIDAALAYNGAAMLIHGEFANLNVV